MLQEFGPSIYSADGPTLSFYGFPYPTRMALVRLSDGGVWVWSPIALTDELADEVQAVGPVSRVVSPNKLHHRFIREWSLAAGPVSCTARPRPKNARLPFDLI